MYTNMIISHTNNGFLNNKLATKGSFELFDGKLKVPKNKINGLH